MYENDYIAGITKHSNFLYLRIAYFGYLRGFGPSIFICKMKPMNRKREITLVEHLSAAGKGKTTLHISNFFLRNAFQQDQREKGSAEEAREKAATLISAHRSKQKMQDICLEASM